MNRALLVILCALMGCATSQSARVLAPGKTRVSAGVSRNVISETDGKPLYLGSIGVSHGVGSGTEVGIHVDRTPGAGQAYSNLGFDGKFQLQQSATSAVSILVPVSVTWEEDGSDLRDPVLIAFPTLLAGFDLSPEAELVVAPFGGAAFAKGESDPLYGIGLSLGLRIGDRTKGSSIQPELGFVSLHSNGNSESLYTLGLAITVGD